MRITDVPLSKPVLLSPENDLKTGIWALVKAGAEATVVVDENRHPIGSVSLQGLMRAWECSMPPHAPLREVLEPPCIVRDDATLDEIRDNGAACIAVVNEDGDVVGVLSRRVLLQFKGASFINDSFEGAVPSAPSDAFFAFLHDYFDVVYATDGEGTTIGVSSAAKRLFGHHPHELIGRKVSELEHQGVFRPSATLKALEQRQRITVIQETKTRRRLLVISNPIFDSGGRIIQVVNASRDISDVDRLRAQRLEIEGLLSRYEQELLRRDEWRKKSEIIAYSPRMKEILELVNKVAPVDSSVLLLGESGVGKEVLARHIHETSNRANKPFTKIDCATIPENLLESELFGHEAGAFTGALRKGKMGLVETADGGTLFLDEIGELPLSLQSKLLRLVQHKEFIRVGGTAPRTVDVRIIAATNRDLLEMTRQGTFRTDLFYRLNVITLAIPPLRERVEDIEPLAKHFAEHFGRKYRRMKQLSHDALERLTRHAWPGNVRELENVIERLVVTTDGEVITQSDVKEALNASLYPSSPLPGGLQPSFVGDDDELVPLEQATEQVERLLLRRAWTRYRNTYRMAEKLGVHQSTIVRKMNRYFPGGLDD